MAIREIPRAFEYVCDVCGKKHLQENAGGHYHDSRPEYWARLIIRQDAHDFQGAGVSDDTIECLLCYDCSSGVIAAINKWSEQKRAAAIAAERTGGKG